MKKITLLLTVIMAFAFCSCGGDDDPQPVRYRVEVKASPQAGGEVYIDVKETEAVTVMAGARLNIKAKAASGYKFKSWTCDVLPSLTVNTAEYTIPSVNSDMVFTAMFEELPKEPVFSKVIFEDQFNQATREPDASKWQLCPKGTPAWCTYMSESYDQAYVEDGKLVLMAEKVNGEYKVGGVRMLNDLGFKYGKVEVSARFTGMAAGAWPAIWMMPSKPTWSGWPQCGEIDIMEHLNKDTKVYSVIHSNYVDNLGISTSPVNQVTPAVDTSKFNTYAITWTSEAIKFYVNDQETLTYPNMHLADEADKKQWPFDAPFYLILNHALGGAGTWPGAINDAQLPAKFEIDWVKVSQEAD